MASLGISENMWQLWGNYQNIVVIFGIIPRVLCLETETQEKKEEPEKKKNDDIRAIVRKEEAM